MTELKQERRLVTEIPGPKSLELFERRNKVVARGISTTPTSSSTSAPASR
jgi:4-aminobutyrate aminotransferase/(S)-3-amino-2-methylpropionate transaminase